MGSYKDIFVRMGVAETREDMKEDTTAEDDSTQELLDKDNSTNTLMKLSDDCHLDRACLASLVSWVVTEEEHFGSALPAKGNSVSGFDTLKSIFLHCFISSHFSSCIFACS